MNPDKALSFTESIIQFIDQALFFNTTSGILGTTPTAEIDILRKRISPDGRIDGLMDINKNSVSFFIEDEPKKLLRITATVEDYEPVTGVKYLVFLDMFGGDHERLGLDADNSKFSKMEEVTDYLKTLHVFPIRHIQVCNLLTDKRLNFGDGYEVSLDSLLKDLSVLNALDNIN